MTREQKITRKTKETQVELILKLDGAGRCQAETGIGFLDHMLALLAQHGLFDLTVKAEGDIAVDFHHTVEDIGISLGEALKGALGDKKGIKRFGWAAVPMDEALALISLDLSGRPHLSYDAPAAVGRTGDFDADLAPEFFSGLVRAAGMTLHIKLLSGDNLHHSLEAIFKGFAKALDQAVSRDARQPDVPSTKGVL